MKESEHAVGQGGQKSKTAPSQEGHAAGPASAAPNLPERLRAAAHDERLSTGALYLEAADVIDALRAAYERVVKQRDEENARAIRAEKGWDEAINRAEAAEMERDLAIAHDRQPYPTADAYETVCKARTHWQECAEAAEAALAQANKRIAQLEHGYDVLREALRTREADLTQANAALEIIAGERQCVDNLMGDKDVAREALRRAREPQ
jgi:hypothetical protein